MKSFDLKKNIKWILVAIIAVIFLMIPVFVKTNATLHIIILMMLYMYFASAWNIMGGYAGLFSLGNGIYVGLGAYVSAILWANTGLTPFIGMILGGLVAAAVSLIVGYPTFKLKGVYYALATVALLTAFKTFANSRETLFGIYFAGSNGYKITVENGFWNMQFATKVPYYYIIFILLVIIILVNVLISKSKLGYYFRSIGANQGSAASLGVNVVRQKLIAQFLTAFFTGIGGAFYAQLLRYFDPATVFGMDMSLDILIYAVVGGAGTVLGPLLGAGILYPLGQILNSTLQGLTGISTVVYGILLAAVVFYMPGGIVSTVKAMWNRHQAKKLLSGKDGRPNSDEKQDMAEGKGVDSK